MHIPVVKFILLISVLVDITPPIPGFTVDGLDLTEDISFSSETATKSVSWDNFTDPESGIDRYQVSMYKNNEKVKTFASTTETNFTDHSVSMDHEDKIMFEVETFNRAGLSISQKTDGYTIDHTPPNLVFIQDNVQRKQYQIDDGLLNLQWEFHDSESGIKEYRYSVFQSIHGLKRRFWPITSNYISILQTLGSPFRNVNITKPLLLGAKYTVHVTAINEAKLSTSHESNGVTVDSTPPLMEKVGFTKIQCFFN